MQGTLAGSIRIFRFMGINVYLHWLWFVLLFYVLVYRKQYQSKWWNLAEFLSLFGIVLMHEFGHALACRSVGGKASQIVLWPLGGIAFVNPPQRPGAVLWSIAAGPLVNVLLVPVTILLFIAAFGSGGMQQALNTGATTSFQQYAESMLVINLVLLIFNLMPIFPLDGGQILWSLLWFVMGQARSLQVSAIIGLVAAVIICVLALLSQNWWIVLIAIFIGMQAWRGYKVSKALLRVEHQELLNSNPWQSSPSPDEPQEPPINRP